MTYLNTLGVHDSNCRHCRSKQTHQSASSQSHTGMTRWYPFHKLANQLALHLTECLGLNSQLEKNGKESYHEIDDHVQNESESCVNIHVVNMKIKIWLLSVVFII